MAVNLTQLEQQYTPAAYDAFWSSLDGYYGQKRHDLYEIVTIYLRSLYLEPQPLRIADVGCGPGYLLHSIAQQFHEHELSLIGVDWSEVALQQAQKLLKDAGRSDAEFLQADLQHNCPLLEAADVVLCIQTLEHAHDPMAFLRHLVAMSRRHIILTVPDGPKDRYPAHVNFWSVDAFSAFLSPYGRLVICKSIRRGHNILAHLEKSDHG